MNTAPFDEYPGNGCVLLGRVRGANCRQGYGLRFMQITKQTRCAYCGLDFAATYENWLQMALDHVVPASVCKALGVPAEWTDDHSNRVLACMACNGFGNRYKIDETVVCPAELQDFFALRDRIFMERKVLIAKRYEEERAFFAQIPWLSK